MNIETLLNINNSVINDYTSNYLKHIVLDSPSYLRELLATTETDEMIYIDYTIDRNIAFINAVARGDMEIIEILLDLEGERKINPNDQNNKAFEISCRQGNSKCIYRLLDLKGERKIVPTPKDLFNIAKTGNVDCVGYILKTYTIDLSEDDYYIYNYCSKCLPFLEDTNGNISIYRQDEYDMYNVSIKRHLTYESCRKIIKILLNTRKIPYSLIRETNTIEIYREDKWKGGRMNIGRGEIVLNRRHAVLKRRALKKRKITLT